MSVTWKSISKFEPTMSPMAFLLILLPSNGLDRGDPEGALSLDAPQTHMLLVGSQVMGGEQTLSRPAARSASNLTIPDRGVDPE
jgi:hypothetical protein